MTALVLAGALLLPAAVQADTPETETEQMTEAVFDKPEVMYLIDTVRVRAEANADSDTIAFADRGDALTVLGELNGWYHVRLDAPEAETSVEETETVSEAEAAAPAKEGFVEGTYLTEEKEEAEQAVALNDAEIQRKEAEAAAAAAAAAEASSSGGGSGRRKKSGKTAVSTQNVDDCDGSGHGTTITTYSDGSTKTSRY
jgi:hypothetical protein